MRQSNFLSLVGGLIALFTTMAPHSVLAQQASGGRYFPLDHRIPGRVSHWTGAINPRPVEYVQPVRIELPSVGLVTYYAGSADNATLTQAPSQAGFVVGKTYRIQISGMPEFPGVELYPSIELFDRLHPPPGQEQDYPIPVTFTVEEIETAVQDRLVTKVLYLEQPQTAVPKNPDEAIHVVDLSVKDNLLQAADQRGRPMAIIRLGGRTPDLKQGSDPGFFGDHSPILSLKHRRLPQDMVHLGDPHAVSRASSLIE